MNEEIHPLIYNRLIELSSEIEKVNKDWRLGITSFDNFNNLVNKSTYDLLRIIDVINDNEFIEVLDHENKVLQSDLKVNSNLVFVIISFDPSMEPIYEGIKNAADKFGLKAERVKDRIGDYQITEKIIEMISSARFIVSDLSLEKPNVYFEHGYARGLKKNIITICREGEKIHFDVKDWTCIFYNDSRTLEKELEKRFEIELDNSFLSQPN